MKLLYKIVILFNVSAVARGFAQKNPKTKCLCFYFCIFSICYAILMCVQISWWPVENLPNVHIKKKKLAYSVHTYSRTTRREEVWLVVGIYTGAVIRNCLCAHSLPPHFASRKISFSGNKNVIGHLDRSRGARGNIHHNNNQAGTFPAPTPHLPRTTSQHKSPNNRQPPPF